METKLSIILALFKKPCVRYIFAMSTVSEIEAVIPKLSRIEVEELRAWIENYLADQLELTDEVKARLDQSRREIAEGQLPKLTPLEALDALQKHLRLDAGKAADWMATVREARR
jgi:ABC-type phosphate transport system ATPase subunit